MTGLLRRSWIQLALIAVAVVWGATFVMVKDAVESYPLYSFLALRFTIAVAAFALLFPRALARMNRRLVAVGLLAGVFLCLGYIFQTWGLAATTASKAAFITGMFVVITPAMQAVILRHIPNGATLLGVAVAVVGLWLLSDASAGGWNAGDTRVLLCAIAYSAHMIVLGSWGARHDVFALTMVQLGTTAVICGAMALATEPLSLPGTGSVWIALLVTGVLASAVAFAVQTYAQRHIPPARTALILISEPAFGGLFGWWIGGDELGVRGLAGALFILAGMVAAELMGMRAAAAGEAVLEPSIEGPSVAVAEPNAAPAKER